MNINLNSNFESVTYKVNDGTSVKLSYDDKTDTLSFNLIERPIDKDKEIINIFGEEGAKRVNLERSKELIQGIGKENKGLGKEIVSTLLNMSEFREPETRFSQLIKKADEFEALNKNEKPILKGVTKTVAFQDYLTKNFKEISLDELKNFNEPCKCSDGTCDKTCKPCKCEKLSNEDLTTLNLPKIKNADLLSTLTNIPKKEIEKI